MLITAFVNITSMPLSHELLVTRNLQRKNTIEMEFCRKTYGLELQTHLRRLFTDVYAAEGMKKNSEA